MKDNSSTFLFDFNLNLFNNKSSKELASSNSSLNLKQSLANNQGCKRKHRHLTYHNKNLKIQAFNEFNKCSSDISKSFNDFNNRINKSKYKKFKYISYVSNWLDNKSKNPKKRTFNKKVIIKKFRKQSDTRCQIDNARLLNKLKKENNNKICLTKTAAKSIIRKYKNSTLKQKTIPTSASSSKSNSTSSLISFISSVSLGNNIHNKNQLEIDENLDLIHNHGTKTTKNNNNNNKPRFNFNHDKNTDEDLISILNTDWLNKFKVIN